MTGLLKSILAPATPSANSIEHNKYFTSRAKAIKFLVGKDASKKLIALEYLFIAVTLAEYSYPSKYIKSGTISYSYFLKFFWLNIKYRSGMVFLINQYKGS